MKIRALLLTAILTIGLWVQLAEGMIWEYHAVRNGNTQVVARCEYQYVRLSGVRWWRGTYFNKTWDFFSGGFEDGFITETELPELCGCVEWVNHFMLGDYYI